MSMKSHAVVVGALLVGTLVSSIAHANNWQRITTDSKSIVTGISTGGVRVFHDGSKIKLQQITAVPGAS